MSKIAAVLAGYVGAFVLAFLLVCALVYVRDHFHLIDAAQASGGMQAFGDGLWFLGIFGFLALFPTAMAFHYLRQVDNFWTICSIVALVVAVTGPVAALSLHQTPDPKSAMAHLFFFALLRVLGAPLLCLGFTIGGIFSPAQRARAFFFAAAGVEGLVSAYAFLCMFVLHHWLV